jgi:hypothetical protein
MDYTTTLNGGNDAGALAALAAASGFILLFALVAYVLTSLGLMQFFKKAGKPGWAAWVPLYNYYVMTEIAEVPMYWFWILIGSVLLSFIPLVSIATIVASVYITHMFLQKYGKDVGHTILAVLFSFVYFPVVGYSKNLSYRPATTTAKSTNTTV